MRYYLAIDIGASSGRHLLGWLEDGKFVTEEIYRFQNGPKEKKTAFGGETEHLIWDVDYLYSEILNGLKKANEIGKIPYSVGIDNWGVDYALLDADGNLIGDVYCYRDSRTDLSIPEVHNIISYPELYERTGIQYATFNTVYQLYSDKQTGKLDSAKTVLLLPSYFNFKLTGVKKQEYTHATTTAMINAKTNTWDAEIIDKLGFDKTVFAPLAMPGTLLGEFTDEVAKTVGYKAKIFLPPTHDTASAVLAAPLKEGAPYISSGTWSLLGVEQKTAHTSEIARVMDYSNEGSINYECRLQKNIMGLWMLQQVRHETGDKYSFVELTNMARASVVDDIIDVNDQRFMAPKNMTEEICAAVGRKLTVGEISYVILNSLAKFYATALDALEKITGETYKTLNIIGGGSKNSLLNELTSKHTGRRIITGPTECTAIGNIMIQMVGAGDIKDVAEGREIIKESFDINEI